MSAVKRYDLEHCDGESGGCNATMRVSQNGDWVSHDDFKELQERYEELGKKVDKAVEALS